MIHFFKILLCLLSCMVAHTQTNWEFKKNQKKVSLPFDLVNNMIIVHPELNGTRVNLLLDSGSNTNVLFGFQENDSIAFANISQIKITGPGVLEPFDAYVSKKNEIKFKNLHLKEATFVLLLQDNLALTSTFAFPIHGILGADFFKNNTVEINYAKKRVIIYFSGISKKINTAFHQIPLCLKEGKPYIPIQLNINDKIYQEVELLVDTGLSDGLWLLHEPKELLEMKSIHDFLGVGLGGDIFGKRSRYSTIKINDFLLDKPIVSFPDSIAFSIKNLLSARDGSIGGEILKRFTLIFDYVHEKFYLKPNRNYFEPFLYNMSGIKIQHGGVEVVEEKIRTDKALTTYNVNEFIFEDFKYRYNYKIKRGFEVAYVRTNSAADKVGILKGDKIVSINKRKVIHFNLDQLIVFFETLEDEKLELEIERDGKLLKYIMYLAPEI